MQEAIHIENYLFRDMESTEAKKTLGRGLVSLTPGHRIIFKYLSLVSYSRYFLHL